MATTNAVITAIQAIITNATTIAEVYTYIPTTVNTEEVLFLYSEPPTYETKSNNLTRKTYNISVWLLVVYIGHDDAAAEARFNDLADACGLALVQSKTLNGTVRSTEVSDVNHNPLVEIDRTIFRVRLWAITAWEDIVTAFS